jgi:hypothetical protein
MVDIDGVSIDEGRSMVQVLALGYCSDVRCRSKARACTVVIEMVLDRFGSSFGRRENCQIVWDESW